MVLPYFEWKCITASVFIKWREKVATQRNISNPQLHLGWPSLLLHEIRDYKACTPSSVV
jgi:hypothetical protein